MISKDKKRKLFAEYSEIFSSLTAGILLDYKGSSVVDITEFRKNLIPEKSSFRVLKNKVAKKALEESRLKDAAPELIQTRALAYTEVDIISLAKIICKELETLENCKIISGFQVEDDKVTFLNQKEVIAMSKLASKEELISKLLYLLQAPITNFARTLNEVPASFVRVLSKISENK